MWIWAEHGVEEQFLRAVGESSEVRLEGEDNDASGTYWFIDDRSRAAELCRVRCKNPPDLSSLRTVTLRDT